MTPPVLAESFTTGLLENLRNPWALVGFLGQFVFGARFLLQWIASEREKRVVIPPLFWWLSIVGALITLTYAIHRRDPVFILANTLNFIIYARNLTLHNRTLPPAASTPA